MLFPLVYSFFLAGSFRLRSCSILPSTHFIYCLLCYPSLSILNWASNLIDLILDIVCSFRYTLISSFQVFLSFWVLILFGFVLLHRDAFFTSACLFFAANVHHGNLSFALSLVGIHSAAASLWALMKSSYLSFRKSVSDIFWCALNVFLSANLYLSQISLFLSRNQS